MAATAAGYYPAPPAPEQEDEPKAPLLTPPAPAPPAPEPQPAPPAPLALQPAPSAAVPYSEQMQASSQWSTGLFDCCAQPGGPALGWVSACLPWVQYGVLAQQLPPGSVALAGKFGVPAAAFLALDGAAALAHCLLVPGVSLLPASALLHMPMRRHIRDKYAIEGTWWRDLLVSWWCAPCALAQETRELVIRNAAEQQDLKQQSKQLMLAPGPNYMVGNLMLPSTTYHSAAAPLSYAPAVGMPVPGSAAAFPPTSVATIGGQQPAKEGYEAVMVQPH